MGRGKAVSDGIVASKSQVTGFLDVDLEVGAEYISKALQLLESCDVVVGKRSFPLALNTVHRYLASKTYAFFSRVLLRLPVHDSEAGFKFFKRVKIEKVLPYVSNWGWFWDTEIIALADIFKLKIKELPVRYIRRTDKTSTVSTLRDSAVYFWNLLNFKIKYKFIKNNYESHKRNRNR
jgi:hypothetical protein